MKLDVHDETEMLAVGAKLAKACRGAAVFYLQGQLGAGKTTLVRGFMRGMGYTGAVKSPTYTLVEPYETGARRLYHLDLYRVREPGELLYLGLRELYERNVIMLVEWPERGADLLPPADVLIDVEYAAQGRTVTLEPLSVEGGKILEIFAGADFSAV